MSDHPLTNEQFNELLRTIRETVRQEIRAEFEGRKAMDRARFATMIDSAFVVPSHVAGTLV